MKSSDCLIFLSLVPVIIMGMFIGMLVTAFKIGYSRGEGVFHEIMDQLTEYSRKKRSKGDNI